MFSVKEPIEHTGILVTSGEAWKALSRFSFSISDVDFNVATGQIILLYLRIKNNFRITIQVVKENE